MEWQRQRQRRKKKAHIKHYWRRMKRMLRKSAHASAHASSNHAMQSAEFGRDRDMEEDEEEDDDADDDDEDWFDTDKDGDNDEQQQVQEQAEQKTSDRSGTAKRVQFDVADDTTTTTTTKSSKRAHRSNTSNDTQSHQRKQQRKEKQVWRDQCVKSMREYDRMFYNLWSDEVALYSTDDGENDKDGQVGAKMTTTTTTSHMQPAIAMDMTAADKEDSLDPSLEILTSAYSSKYKPTSMPDDAAFVTQVFDRKQLCNDGICVKVHSSLLTISRKLLYPDQHFNHVAQQCQWTRDLKQQQQKQQQQSQTVPSLSTNADRRSRRRDDQGNRDEDDISDMDRDDDDDDDDDDDEKIAPDENGTKVVIGNIAEKLQTEQCGYVQRKVSVSELTKHGSKRMTRLFGDTMLEFTTKCVADKNELSEAEKKSYPQKHRFVMVVDRRGAPQTQHDEMTIFDPPQNCNRFPPGRYEPLWYFDSSRQCIIPNAGYHNGLVDDDKLHASVRSDFVSEVASSDDLHRSFALKEFETSRELVCSISDTNGEACFLSFHVEAVNVIRAYLYLDHQILRFFPEDIINILPQYFIDSNENVKFVQSKEAQSLVADMKKKLVDEPFDAFYRKYSMFAK